jgi:hypothetical protein
MGVVGRGEPIVAPPGVGHDLEAEPPEVVRVLWGRLAGRALLRPPLDGNRDQERLPIVPLSATLQARLLAADRGLIHLHLAGELAAIRIDHRAAQLVEHQPGRLVVDVELLAELECRDAGLQRGHEVGGGEPGSQGQAGAMEDRAGGRRGLVPAAPALPEPARAEQACVGGPAPRAAEALRPAGLDEVVQACLIAREAAAELRQVPRVVAEGPSAHARTLHLVSC